MGVFTRLVVSAAMAFASLATAAQAAQSVPDFRASPAPLLRNADFDGDGLTDTIRLVNDGNGRIAVHVALGDKDVRVTSFDVSATPVMRIAPAGSYVVDCGSFSTDCTGERLDTRTDSLIVTSEGASVLLRWQEGGFEPEFIKSYEDDMARVASALYALNPEAGFLN